MTAQTSFGQWLKQRRKTLDLTREDLAQRVGCAAITLKKIEADQRRPSTQMAELLAEHLNIPQDERPAFVRFARAEPTEEAAPWGTPFHPPTNLPAQPTLLIGRAEDVAAIRKRLLRDESRLLTLTGPPGIGKTRLALQVAAQMLDGFVDGVFFIALAAITDPHLVPATIASTLGVPDVGPRTPLERLKAYLRDTQMLLVLDNFEQILAAAPQIAELLSACPWLKVLVTSRAPLRIRHERQFPVSSLTLPDLARLPDVETVTGYSAVTLFLERAQAVKPDFSLTQDNAPTVAALCTRLDGLPLAIELISARVKLLSPATLLERLGGRLMLQSDGLRDLEPRHRTLNAAIDWSYQLLTAEEQTLFRRLGVFVGGWTLEAAEAVCLEDLELSILDGLASLLDKNLVKQDTRTDGEPRFTMLETIREYALEQLAARGEVDNLRKRHADYFTALVERTGTDMTRTAQRRWLNILEAEHDNFRAGQRRWLNTLEAEHDNFRAALASRAIGLRLTLGLCVFWQRRGHMSEGSAWLAAALKQHEVSLPTTVADRVLRAKALDWLAVFNMFQGDLDTPQPYYEESLAVFRELGDKASVAEVLTDFGMLFQMRGDYKQAGNLLEEGLVLQRELGNTNGIAWSLHFLGTLALTQGETKRAGAFWEESLIGMRAEGDIWGITNVLGYLAKVKLVLGDYVWAGVYLVESLVLLRELSERWQIAHNLEVFACLAAVQGQQTEDTQPCLLRSARIFGAAEVLRETLSAPMFSFQQQFYNRGVATLRAQLDEATFAAAWAEGRAMTLDQVVAYALEGSEP